MTPQTLSTTPTSRFVTTAQFTAIIDFVLASEGGYANDPLDPGGETNFGIAKRFHPDVDIRALTREGAVAIYKAEYWDANRCGELPPAVALSVMDAGVNCGVGQSARWLQDAVGTLQDGKIGPKTINATRKYLPIAVVEALCQSRMDYYRTRPGYARYGHGWSNRVAAVQSLGKTWA